MGLFVLADAYAGVETAQQANKPGSVLDAGSPGTPDGVRIDPRENRQYIVRLPVCTSYVNRSDICYSRPVHYGSVALDIASSSKLPE